MTCTTHYHACQCREEHFEEIESKLAQAEERIEKLDAALSDERMENTRQSSEISGLRIRLAQAEMGFCPVCGGFTWGEPYGHSCSCEWYAAGLDRLNELTEKFEKYEEALKLYATRENYYAQSVRLGCGCCSDTVEAPIEQDEGKRAREALDAAEKEKSDA